MNQSGKLVTIIKKLLGHPLGVIIIAGAMVLEALLVDPRPYELYAMTWHGFFLGMVAFLLGFSLVSPASISMKVTSSLLRWT